MANPFREAMGGSQTTHGGRRNLAPNLIRYMQNFRGNPMQMLQEKINSSGISQEQCDQLRSAAEKIAQQMMGIMGR